MASNFSSLRSSRKNLLGKLAEEAKKEAQKGSRGDEGFWKLSVDAKTKIGYARIRFLPAPQNEELPWVRVFSHQFKGPQGSWLWENCPTTLGERSCPICKENNKLWNSGVESDKDVARNRKRKLQFISNILVVEDPAHPENNGKVFLFKYGAKIYDKIKELIEPEFPDSEPANPFDLWEGADFKLKSRDVAGYQNYDKSEFDKPSELFKGDDEKKETIWQQEKSLAAFVAETEFKSFEVLQKKLVSVLTGDGSPQTAEDAIKAAKATPTQEDAKETAEAVAKQTRKPRTKKEDPAPADDAPEEDDDVQKFFAELEND